MLEHDLRVYRCPQQFIQFKLGLRKALSLNQNITFSLNQDDAASDIMRFLQKYSYNHTLDKHQGLLLVELLHV